MTPELVPRVFATDRAAWEGPRADRETSSCASKPRLIVAPPVSFRVDRPLGTASATDDAAAGAADVLARRREHAGHRRAVRDAAPGARATSAPAAAIARGAWRLFCVALTALAASWIVSGRHYASLLIEDDRLFEFLAHAFMNAGATWLLYVALEPTSGGSRRAS